jgi:D-hydroxyproline dehydrogenase subunit gamma
MRDTVDVSVNGKTVSVPEGSTISAAVALSGAVACRTSTTGQLRGPLCGMGICFECRVSVNGIEHVRGCQVLCEPGMDVRTTAGAA